MIDPRNPVTYWQKKTDMLEGVVAELISILQHTQSPQTVEALTRLRKETFYRSSAIDNEFDPVPDTPIVTHIEVIK